MIAALLPLAIVLTQPAALPGHRISRIEPLVVSVPVGWVAGENEPPNPAFPFETTRFVPADDRNAACLISFIAKDRAEFADRRFLTLLVRGDSRPYLEPGQDPSEIEVKELQIRGGLAVYATFVDPDLVGKPSVRGDFKTATPILLPLGTSYLIKITIFCDDSTGRDFIEALELVKSIRVGPPES
jgi:hypothetical protein